MGLSSKQVSSDGLDWNKLLQTGALDIPKVPQQRTKTQTQQQQQSPPLRCPRCDSNNTKFCYYNNYNRSQPRHFCKACRRHWTKGGTLRNVPVGGGRKNKRLKTTTTTSRQGTNSIAIQQQQQQMPLGLGLTDHKTISEILYSSFIHQPPPLPHHHYINEDNNSNTFMGSLLFLPPMPNFPLTSFDNNDPSSNSISLQSPFLSTVAPKTEDPPLTLPLDSVQAGDNRDTRTPWQIPTSNLVDSSCWSWDDFTNFVSQPLPGSQFP